MKLVPCPLAPCCPNAPLERGHRNSFSRWSTDIQLTNICWHSPCAWHSSRHLGGEGLWVALRVWQRRGGVSISEKAKAPGGADTAARERGKVNAGHDKFEIFIGYPNGDVKQLARYMNVKFRKRSGPRSTHPRSSAIYLFLWFSAPDFLGLRKNSFPDLPEYIWDDCHFQKAFPNNK